LVKAQKTDFVSDAFDVFAKLLFGTLEGVL